MTRFEWLVLRKKQGHKILVCECGHVEPEYNAWYHIYCTGHEMKEAENYGSRSQQTSST